jgi:hypothetical protein
MSTPKIPTTYTHNLKPTDTFDVDTMIEGGLDTNVSGSLSTDNVLKLTGDSKQPVITDSKIELLNLPRFTLKDIHDLKKTRVRIPNYSNVCFKMMGVEFFSICMSGEGQIITEPYEPTAAERCEDDCCQPDTRPFPGDKRKENEKNKRNES